MSRASFNSPSAGQDDQERTVFHFNLQKPEAGPLRDQRFRPLLVYTVLCCCSFMSSMGFLFVYQLKTVYVQPGKTIEIEWANTPITGQIQIQKFAASANSVTGTAAGAPLQGAVYEISEARSGKVVDCITTDARGVAASKPLSLGRYKIVEVAAQASWLTIVRKLIPDRRAINQQRGGSPSRATPPA